ncbi:hypothetical protein SAMN05216429_106131 [Marinobacter persicus]|uniref:Uncharacterized protein n=1 Tax=Marinobacter persicus TaxID=930118 RepID=A0A1I3UG41_9GAMM|nr:hypothetical protein SAMN05216429_106131 [Marinobacter persicus]
MNELTMLEYSGIFAACWAFGFALSYKILAFKKLADEVI